MSKKDAVKTLPRASSKSTKTSRIPPAVEARLRETEDLIAELEHLDYDSDEEKNRRVLSERVMVWGLPLARVTMQETVDLVDKLIAEKRPGLFITANLHYAMLAERHLRLQVVNARATFILADGMPMVWYSRLKGLPLPERVTGSDLIFKLCERASQRGHRVFLLGGAPGIAEQAKEKLCRKYPGLKIVGVAAPMVSEMSRDEQKQLIESIRSTKSDLLFVAFGQPKGEMWLAEHCRALGVPVCVQVGTSFDFAAEKVKRAPKWVQQIGMEWLYRIMREPVRMAPRYFQDSKFLVKAICRDAGAAVRPSQHGKKRG